MISKYLQSNIVEYLGSTGWDNDRTTAVEIHMPLRQGTLLDLVKVQAVNPDTLCRNVLFQIPKALDYLDNMKYCHRDLKPENILYTDLGNSNYAFQLADFGLAKLCRDATSYSGTHRYMAPEVQLAGGPYSPAETQTPKVDVWSLFVSIIDVHPKFDFPPVGMSFNEDILPAIQGVAAQIPHLQPMAGIVPQDRASAGTMLISLFGGKGMTNKRDRVEPPVAVFENWNFEAVEAIEAIEAIEVVEVVETQSPPHNEPGKKRAEKSDIVMEDAPRDGRVLRSQRRQGKHIPQNVEISGGIYQVNSL